jgi:hypothetical protein
VKPLDAWHIACTLALVGFACRIDLSICGLAPREHKGNLGASRAALRCNRIQLDAEEAGPTSPVFFWCAEHVRQLEGESPFDNLMEVKS